ncbi:MAG TPA: chorismate synthase [Actinomycetota bacterium]|nr:chorismate synthase [Actinomycetota bacterium]
MGALRYLTAGESHGPALTVIVEGLPAGLRVTSDQLSHELARRRQGYGRGARMKLEADDLEILGGVRHGRTLGSPVAVVVRNTEFVQKWSTAMSPDPVDEQVKPLTRPRPGHADLVGIQKYGHRDARNVLERASARETAARTVAGTLARLLLAEIDVQLVSHVVAIGKVWSKNSDVPGPDDVDRIEASAVRCQDSNWEAAMIDAIEKAKADGDTLGGVFEVVAHGVPVGLGSYVHWDRKIDGRLAQALLSINAMKAVAVGDGFEAWATPGSEAHDEILWDEDAGYHRTTNRAGGIEGGVTNGDPLRVRVVMKPLSTLRTALRTVDIETKQEEIAIVERTDTCAVPSACVIGEATVAFVLADAALEKFGGDSVDEFTATHRAWLETLKKG